MIYLIYTELPKLSVFSSPLCPGQLMVVDGLRKLKQGRGLWRVRVNTLKRACIPWHVFRVVGPSFSLQDLLWLKFGGHMWSKTKNTHVYMGVVQNTFSRTALNRSANRVATAVPQ